MTTDLLMRAASAIGWFLARYGAVVVMLYGLSTVSEMAGFAARVLASWLALVVCALYGVAVSAVLRLSGGSRWQNAQWATARAFKFTMALLTGVVFVVEDAGHVLSSTRPAVIIGNHQTALDVLMLGSVFPQYCSVTAKSQLKHYPFLGWFMRLSGTIFIDRANSRDAREAMRGASDVIRDKRQNVYMFPEGTRSHSLEPTLAPFKKGAFHLAVQAGVPIVPVVVANYSHIYAKSKLRFRRGRVPVKGLTAEDVTDLTNRTHDIMQRELASLTERARSEAISDATASTSVAVPLPASGTGVATSIDTAL